MNETERCPFDKYGGRGCHKIAGHSGPHEIILPDRNVWADVECYDDIGPQSLCDVWRGQQRCVFYAGHKGPHRIVTTKHAKFPWIDFLATLLLVGCGSADFSSAALEVQTDAGSEMPVLQWDGNDSGIPEVLETLNFDSYGSDADAGAIGSDAPSCSPSTSCQAQGFTCGQVFDGCEEVTCPTPYQVTGYSYDCVNAGLGPVLYLCGGDHSAPAPNNTCTLLPHIVGSTMWCCSQ